jgi:hypothetical protein
MTACFVLTLNLACRRGSVQTTSSQCLGQQRETSVPQKEMTRQAEITSCGATLPQKSVRTNGTLRPPVCTKPIGHSKRRDEMKCDTSQRGGRAQSADCAHGNQTIKQSDRLSLVNRATAHRTTWPPPSTLCCIGTYARTAVCDARACEQSRMHDCAGSESTCWACAGNQHVAHLVE